MSLLIFAYPCFRLKLWEIAMLHALVYRIQTLGTQLSWPVLPVTVVPE